MLKILTNSSILHIKNLNYVLAVYLPNITIKSND